MLADASTLHTIPSGVEGVRATLRHMRRLARAGKVTSAARSLAELITRNLPPKDSRAEIDAVFRWIKGHIRYVRDIRGVETVSTVERLLRVRTGDCDDMAVLASALLESIGFHTRFVALGFDGAQYSHVITEVQLGAGWIPLDCTVRGAFLGWYPPRSTSRMVCHV